MARTHPRKHHSTIDKEERANWLRKHATAGYYIGTKELEGIRIRFIGFRDARLLKPYSQPCYVCAATAKDWHHVVYLSRGGDNSSHNLVPLCQPCHKKVHRHDPVRGNRTKAKIAAKRFVSPFVTPIVVMTYVPPK